MPLAAGTKLGPYEITAPLGAGGMGEVYRARDTRLDRVVAIKILPQHLSEKPAAKERFDREARAISSLSHPNICHLYDVGEQNGINYLVMECLEGETLADRLRKGPLTLEQVLKAGAEICEGLEKAHRNGVVHRDLKPSNIMLTKNGAKLMDFGLAKATSSAIGASSPSDSLPTMSQSLTAEGTIVGTFQYMSPEQLEGKEADSRSDIFSLGAILYEMVTGKRAFDGKTTASTIAAVLAAEPKPISAIQPTSPPALEHVITACLGKDPDERLQSVHDVKVELHWIAQTGSPNGMRALRARHTNWDRMAWLFVCLLLLITAVGGAAWWARVHQTPTAKYFNSTVTVPLPANDVALSPDGRFVALVAYSDQANMYVIWTHEVGSRRAAIVPGTGGASHPFWSPDGRFIGFFANGKLKKVDASGGSVQVLCDAPHGRGGAWNRDGVILFSPDVFLGLFRVSSAGGTPVEVTKPDGSRLETSHRWPVFMPDGRHFLYLAANFAGHFEKNEIFLGALDSTEKRPIVSASANFAYSDPGYLLYWRDNALVAQKFDVRSYALSGEARTISDEVQYLPQIDLALFDVAGRGTLVVQAGKGAAKSQLKWFDRSGKQLSVVGPPGSFANPTLSPDGRRVAFDQPDPGGRNEDVWIRELSTDSLMRFTFGPGLNQVPIWRADGNRLLFASNQGLEFALVQKNADGSGPQQHLANLGGLQQGFWDCSRDGKYLLLWKYGELWYMPLPDGEPKPLLQAQWFVRNAQFSPDGRWLAYSTNETGDWEVYVAPFPSVNGKWQVSRGGGGEPRWRRDGKELFYLSSEGRMMAVTVKTDGNFEAASPVTLFQTHLGQPISSYDLVSYDVTGDGQRFLINTKVDEPSAAPLSITLNWASEMEK